MVHSALTSLRALGLGAAVALASAFATPAQADEYDTARIIGGLVALGIIAHALSDDDDPVVHRRGYGYQRTHPHAGYPRAAHPPRVHHHRHSHQPQVRHPRAGVHHRHKNPGYVQRPRQGAQYTVVPQRRAAGQHRPHTIHTYSRHRHGYGYQVRRQTNHPGVISPNH